MNYRKMELSQFHYKEYKNGVGGPERPSLLDGISFLIGVFSAFFIQVVGQLYLAELILPVIIIVMFRKRWWALRPTPIRIIIISGGLWLINLIITDIYRYTPQNDAMRGWALITVFILDFIGLYFLLFPSIRRMTIYILGAAIGLLLQTVLQPSQYFFVDRWKFGYGYPLILLIMVVGILYPRFRFSRSKLWIIFLSLFGIFIMYVGSRAEGGIVILSSFIIWFRTTRLGKSFAAHLTFINLLSFTILLFILVFVILYGYAFAAERGYLGEVAKYKHEMQSGGGTIGVILSARPELIPSFYAIADSPFLGHGSWARDPQAHYREYLAFLVDWGYINISQSFLSYQILSSDLLPTHSHILQAWVWAGIAGIIFWLIILFLVVKALINAFRQPNVLFSLTIFLGLLALWDLFFSPFGAFMREKWAFSLNVFLYWLLLNKTNNRSNLEKKNP